MNNEALVGLIGGKLQNMLASYLQSVEGLDPRDPAPVFFMPRSDRVDLLLRCLVARPDVQTATQLGVELVALHDQHLSPASCAASSWARHVARRIHRVKGAVPRMLAYVQELECDADSDDEIPVFVCDDEPATLEEGDVQAALQWVRERQDSLRSDFLYRQVVELRQQLAQLSRGSILDVGSGLPNRCYFEHRLAQEVDRASRGMGGFMVVAIRLNDIDVEGVAQIDALIRAAGQAIAGKLRGYDLCCRSGERELGVILPGLVNGSRTLFIRRLRGLLEQLDLPARVAVGSAAWGEDGQCAEELLDHAHTSLWIEELVDGVEVLESSTQLDEEGESATVRFEGFPQAVRVQATATERGLRLRLPLNFLRAGSPVYLDAGEGEALAGTLSDTTIGGGHRAGAPVLQVEVATSQVR